MSTELLDTISVPTGIDKEFIERILTTDVELTDALFELIDNSIDSARNDIVSTTDYHKDEYGLPNDYHEYQIDLKLSNNEISILDNCQGFFSEENLLNDGAFITGKPSRHKYGIGSYGLGLKRALLKAGSKFELITDNGKYEYRAAADSALSNEQNLQFKRYPTTGERKTLFVIKDLKSETKYQIKDISWCDNLIEQISIRYAIFIKKGLQINLKICTNNIDTEITIKPLVPNLRSPSTKDSKIPYRSESLPFKQFKAYFDVGVHENYRFAGESDHNTSLNKKLTKFFGIYYICNDRVIVDRSTSPIYGFSTSVFHSEYNGFVCIVRMIAENPSDLPWNTDKTDVKRNSPDFLKLKKKVEELSKNYRADAKKVINIWKNLKKEENITEDEKSTNFHKEIGLPLSTSLEFQENTLQEGNPSVTETQKKPTKKKRNIQRKHTKDEATLLPNKFPSSPSMILNNLIIEGRSLKIKELPHTSCMLYRGLFETALKYFINKSKNNQKVLDAHNSSMQEEKRRKQDVDGEMIRKWLPNNKEVFPLTHRGALYTSMNKLINHYQKLNGIVHGNQVVTEVEIITIRNDTLELLEFFVSFELSKDD
ncbi:hypothetical protein BegalDRAFT_3198 [Beggiatoa alba B18LD]|uniref:Molecular chaperone of HSP90 family n=1 Tax=Beggiatoa alba B18LD TaxID=395493 RepID=I3CK76_9GAMM|nr:ATP-binding protein [Beggiatoa alba]EIJ44019.1 hypothetical protein BegalDRAFT_3198 [Beggiatoa alba B18LD]